jgi:methionyl-tRNA synthetase
MSKDKFYITTSIAYTNAPPHVGFALELVQADVLARYNKISGKDVFFLTGTDEHGIKIQRKAGDEGKKPEDFVNEISGKFKDLAEILNISNNDFIRTTDKERHWPVVEKIWLELKRNGDIEKRKYKGFYCVGCEAFVKEKELVDGKCPIHQKAPEVVEEENWFFKLSKYSEDIKLTIKNDDVKITPEGRKNEMLAFIDQGLEDVSFSRPKDKLRWGIPVPGDENQTIYVWADALVNYISALGYPDGEKFKQYWPADIHCVGKDILRFHAIIWIGMLLSLKLPLPQNILVHGFITSGGQKMSKSLGNVVDPFDLVKKYGADAVRYFLLSEIPTTEDGDFSEKKFTERYNADLANNLGNLLNRILPLVEKNFSGKIPESKIEVFLKKERLYDVWYGYPLAREDNAGDMIVSDYFGTLSKIIKIDFNRFNLDSILFHIIGSCRMLNAYIEDNRLFGLVKEDEKKSASIIYNVLESLRIISWLLSPFVPKTADKIFEQLGLDSEKERKKSFEEAIKWGGVRPGSKIEKGDYLFKRIQ